LSIAKGLAYSLKIPIIGLSTLEILAFPFALTKLPIYPVLRVSKDRIATAKYINDETWQCLQQEHLTTVELLCKQITEQVVFCGELNEEICEILKKNLGSNAILPKLPTMGRSESIARLGWERLSDGKHDNVFTLQPHYLREPHITRSKKHLPFPAPGQLPAKEKSPETNGSKS
jgi:tRNA threonylcarbamoyladenosine biosynthesis protein TsaB